MPRAVYQASWVVDRVLDRLSGGRFDAVDPHYAEYRRASGPSIPVVILEPRP